MPEPDSTRVESNTVVSYSNNIGQAAPASSTTYGILVEGKDYDGEVPAIVVNILLNRGARITSQIGYIKERSREFTLSMTCDLADAKGTLDDLVIQLRRTKHVTYAEAVSLKNQLFNGLLFPLILMETNRVVAISSNLMFKIQEKLNSKSEKDSLVEAGRDYGKDIVNKIRQKFEDNKKDRKEFVADIKTLQENVKGYLKASGWGKFSWESEENFERIVVSDPPTATEGGSGAGNLFLHGLMAGMSEALRNKRYGIMEDHYDPQNRRLTATLIEENRMQPVEAPTSEALSRVAPSSEKPSEAPSSETLSLDEKTKVLDEIEKIINYVDGKETVESLPVLAGKIEQDTPEKVATIPSSDSGNRVHITLKRKNVNAGSGSSTSGENIESPIIAAKIAGTSFQNHVTSPKHEENVPNNVNVKSAVGVSEKVTMNKPSKTKENKTETHNALESSVPEQGLHIEKRQNEVENDKNNQKHADKTRSVEAGTNTLEDLQNRNDILIALLKRKRDLHYKEDDDFDEIREEEHSNI